MADGTKQDTALGLARARFVEGLERRAKELREAIGQLRETPDADRPREEMRRRLHALFASAQVFRIGSLAEALNEAIGRLDAARDGERPLSPEDLEVLSALADGLPGLGGGGGTGEAGAEATPPAAAPPSQTSTPPRRQPTIRGMTPAAE
ncbi:MAG: hypothetical protein ACODAU_04500, partial [Myxococcota bacterium]